MAQDVVTHTIKWRNHKNDIFDEQQNLFKNNIACDCVLISSEGKRIQAHQIVLSSSSIFFESILSDLPITIEPTIHIPDADACVIESLLKFIYTGETSIASSRLNLLVELCNTLNIKGFAQNAATMNCENIKTENEIDSQQLKTPKKSSTSESEDYFFLLNSENAQNQNEYELYETDQDYDIEYLEDESTIEIKEDLLDNSDDSKNDISIDVAECFSFEVEKAMRSGDDKISKNTNPPKRKQHKTRSSNSQIEEALSEVNKGKTIHRLSVEYNLPRSTLYHRFRNSEHLKQNYRLERKSALDQAVKTVLDERLSLKKASERYKVPKTAIWREVRKFDQYKPSNKEIPAKRQHAQREMLSGKSLTSISAKYGIPMTTLHRDKKKLSNEGKLPESFRVRDRTENSEYNQRLEMALQKCRQGMSQYQAAKLYQIPKATMWRYAHALMKVDQKTTEDANESEQSKD